MVCVGVGMKGMKGMKGTERGNNNTECGRTQVTAGVDVRSERQNNQKQHDEVGGVSSITVIKDVNETL